MKNFILLITVYLTGLIVCNNVVSQNSSLANIDDFILNDMELSNKLGLAACIIKGDSMVWSENYGYANIEDSIPVSDSTMFTLCSVSKAISAACALQLWDENILDLDEDINNFLPFQIDNPYSENDSISARMLLTFTSSIKDNNIQSYFEIGDPTVSLGYFCENYLSPGGEYYDSSNFVNAQPGTIQCYSNIASGVWGYLIEPLMGTGMKEYARQYLFAPLEMESSAWFLSELNIENLAIGYIYSGGAYQPQPHYGVASYPGVILRSTVQELGHFLIMLMNGGLYKNNQLLSENIIDSMMTLQPPFYSRGLGINYNCVWNYHGTFQRNVWGKRGGSFTFAYAGVLQYCPDDNTGIVFFSNSGTFPLNIQKRLFDYAAMIVIAEPAIGISQTGLTGTWQQAPDADFYFLDLSTDENFSTFLPGFENLDVGSDTSYQIIDLTANTDYYYRIRAVNEYDTGAYSNTVIVPLITNTNAHKTSDFNIWAANRNVYINLQNENDNSCEVSLYSISGQLIGHYYIKERMNIIQLNLDRQLVIVKVTIDDISYFKKIML